MEMLKYSTSTSKLYLSTWVNVLTYFPPLVKSESKEANVSAEVRMNLQLR